MKKELFAVEQIVAVLNQAGRTGHAGGRSRSAGGDFGADLRANHRMSESMLF